MNVQTSNVWVMTATYFYILYYYYFRFLLWVIFMSFVCLSPYFSLCVCVCACVLCVVCCVFVSPSFSLCFSIFLMCEWWCFPKNCDDTALLAGKRHRCLGVVLGWAWLRVSPVTSLGSQVHDRFHLRLGGLLLFSRVEGPLSVSFSLSFSFISFVFF